MAESARLDELQRKYAENPRRYFAPLANEYRKAGELSTAVAICREELARFPGHMSGHVVLGQALYESRRPTEAQAAFERALALDPENLIALRHLGDIARDRGDLREARTWYERVLEADPRNDDIAAQLSRLAPGYGRPTQAPAYVPHPTMPVPPTAPTPTPAAEPLLEPLEWTALDLGISGQPASESSVEPADASSPEAESGAPDDLLLDFEPSQLEPPASGARPVVEPAAEEPRLSDSFSVISDEVSAIADDHGLVDPVERTDDRSRPAESREALLYASPEAEQPGAGAESAFVVQAPEDATAVIWDDLLASLEVDSHGSEASAAPVFDAGSPVPEPAPEPALEPAAGPTPVPAGGLTDEPLAERIDLARETPAAAGEVDAPVEVPRILVEPAAAEPPGAETPTAAAAADHATVAEATAPEQAPSSVEAAWQLSVEQAHEVELTPFEPAYRGADAQPVATRESPALADPESVGALDVRFAELRLRDATGDLPAADLGPPSPTAVPAAEEGGRSVAELPPAPRDVPVEEAADVYDFLVPFDGPPSRAAASPVSAAEWVEVDEPSPADAADSGPGAPTVELPFSLSPGSSYDPVVGLDVPPAPAVPPVLAAAVPELDAEGAGSPAPAGAFVTETMAQLLSQQGHLEQALDVYAQLQAHRPHDVALRARADAVRARLSPPSKESLGPSAESPSEASPLDADVPTAGAFFASLALDEAAAAEARDVDPTETTEAERGPAAALEGPAVYGRRADEDVPAVTVARAARAGFFDARSEPADERAAARLARAFGVHDDESSSLVSAIFDARVTAPDAATTIVPAPIVPAPPSPEPSTGPAAAAAPAPQEAPYGLGEFSFERFFAGLEEDGPPAASFTPDGPPSAGAVDVTPLQATTDATGSPELAAPMPHAGGAQASDARTSEPDPTQPIQAGGDDEDLAQFNAWLKGLLEP